MTAPVSMTLVVMLLACVKCAEAESFMDNWLSKQMSQTQDDWLSQQLAGNLQQMTSPSAFNEDDWLSRQKAKAAAESLESVATGSHDDVTFSQEAWTPAASWEADEDLEEGLLSDIEQALGKEHRHLMEDRIAAIEESMLTMFTALPKNEYGKLGHSSVRYMLHRFFVEQHGWFIDGLFTEGAALNASSPSHALKGRVPLFVQGLFEKRLGGRGFGIHEVGVLAGIVEDSVHQEAQAELRKTYKALGLSTDMRLDESQLEMIIEVHMSAFVMNTNVSAISLDDLLQQTSDMLAYYPSWQKAQSFFRQVQQNHAGGKRKSSFRKVSAIVRELVNTFGTFHGKQCQGLKSTLTDIEGKGSSGCVNLPDFYSKGLKADTNWLFIESPEYLRQIGVLDESDPQNPRLLSANYINSPSNCVQASGYYLVCCHNECDDILGQLEKSIGKASATPTEIMSALRTFSNPNAASLRVGMLAPTLRRRLQEVADYHDGSVPIHGRLFAQWLHHVFPHECPYPYVSGSKHPQWVQDFEDETGKVSQLTDEEMKSFVLKASKTPSKTLIADAGTCAPWQNEEELFAPLPRSLPLHALEDDPHVWNVAAGIAFLAASSTFAITLLQTLKSMKKLHLQHFQQHKMLLV